MQATSDPTWSISISKVSVLLLQSVSDNPLYVPSLLVLHLTPPSHAISRSTNAEVQLKAIEALLSPQSSSKPSGSTTALLRHLIIHQYYNLIGGAISRIVSIYILELFCR